MTDIDYPKHIVATGSSVRNKTNQILLVKTEVRGWELPGGQIEEGEDMVHALKREVLEEAGIYIKVLKLAACYSSISNPCKVIIDFISTSENETPKKANEIIDVSWFTPQEALSHVKNNIMAYRLEWLLCYENRVRYASFLKNPFKIISEAVF